MWDLPWLGLMQLGMGAGGDVMTALSQREAAKQRNAQRERMQDPRVLNAYTQQLFDAQRAQMGPAVQSYQREITNPMLGMQGIDPSGGAGRLITDRALAAQLSQMYANAQNQAQGMISGSGQYLQQPYGQFGGTQQALYGLGQQQMMNQLMNPSRRNLTATRPDGSGGANPSGLLDTQLFNPPNYKQPMGYQNPFNSQSGLALDTSGDPSWG